MATGSSGEIKDWVPGWLTKVILFMVILPSMGLFGLSSANSNAAAGFYGFEPADVQYSMIVFYAAVTSFFALERRFFNYIAVKEYLLLGAIIQVGASYICYITQNLHTLFIFRFIQGMANCSITSICLTLVFRQLKGERAREIGYSVFYGMLLCVSQISMMVTSPILESFDFNILYKGIMFLFIPGTISLYCILKNVRLSDKSHLYNLDWPSFVIYASLLLLIGYILIYGQQYYWFEDKRIFLASAGVLIFLALHLLRQRHLKRPYMSLDVFKYRNFKVGAILIFILYICRGTINVTNSYFATVMGMDPIHVAYMLLVNSLGIILGAFVTARLVVLKKPMRFIWMAGFSFLLIFHIWMRMSFTYQANDWSYLAPLFIQGLGAGTLMAPLILYMVSSVPAELGGMASATGVFFRYFGFCSSIAIINYYGLLKQSLHLDRFSQHITALDPVAVQKLASYKQAFLAKGMNSEQATKLANAMLSRSMKVQSQLRYAMDYYELISWCILVIILLIAIYPYINRTIVNVKANQPAPASF
jgi:MFS family permease